MMHVSQRGFLATHVARPWRIMRRLNAPRSPDRASNELRRVLHLDRIAPLGRGELLGQTEPLGQRRTWVSTGSPGRPNATLRATLPVLRPTPGSVTRSSRSAGTVAAEPARRPPRRADQALGLRAEEAGRVDELLQLVRVAAARLGARVLAESAGVTVLTRMSVVCADRMVATGISNAFSFVEPRRALWRCPGRARPGVPSPAAPALLVSSVTPPAQSTGLRWPPMGSSRH